MRFDLNKEIRRHMKSYGVDRAWVISMYENHGRQDGRTSKTLGNPAHASWPAGPHFNPHYEKGYWEGYTE